MTEPENDIGDEINITLVNTTKIAAHEVSSRGIILEVKTEANEGDQYSS